MPETPPETLPNVEPMPLLALLGSLLSARLAALPALRGLRLAGLRLHGEAAELELSLEGVSHWVDGTYRVRVDVLATDAERTECRLAFPDARGLGRAVNAGLKAAAGPRLNALLARHLGDAVQVEEERVVLWHAPLLRRLLHGRT